MIYLRFFTELIALIRLAIKGWNSLQEQKLKSKIDELNKVINDDGRPTQEHVEALNAIRDLLKY